MVRLCQCIPPLAIGNCPAGHTTGFGRARSLKRSGGPKQRSCVKESVPRANLHNYLCGWISSLGLLTECLQKTHDRFRQAAVGWDLFIQGADRHGVYSSDLGDFESPEKGVSYQCLVEPRPWWVRATARRARIMTGTGSGMCRRIPPGALARPTLPIASE